MSFGMREEGTSGVGGRGDRGDGIKSDSMKLASFAIEALLDFGLALALLKDCRRLGELKARIL